MDLAAVNFEGFPNHQRVACNASGSGAKIHAKKHDAQIFVHGRDAILTPESVGIFCVLMFTQSGMNVQPGPAISCPFSNRYASGAKGVSTVTKAARLQPGWIKLGDLDRFFARIAFRSAGHSQHGPARSL